MTKLVSKSELMDNVIAGRGHESFSHSVEGDFDITLMRAWAAVHAEVVEITLDQIVPFLRESRVFEEARVAELKPESFLLDPIMFVEYVRPDGTTHLMIDGSHRAMRRFKEGLLTVRAYMITEPNIIRPSSEMVRVPGVDWGDDIVGGKIVKRT